MAYDNLTGMNTYVGLRYVPIVAGEWDITKSYEALTIVLYQGNSYTSKNFVPAGIDITNTTYWVISGNYNAQVEMYRQEVEDLAKTVGKGVKKYTTTLTMLTDTTLVDKDIVVTSGYKNTEDDYGAVFYITTSQKPFSLSLSNGLYANFLGDEIIPQQIGAYCDGSTDDTAIINICTANFKTINFVNGTYSVSVNVDKGQAIFLSSNSNIHFNNATIALKPNNFMHYGILCAQNVENIKISGNGILFGDKNTHTGTTGEWGCCINLLSAVNITINDIKINDGWGDGIYIDWDVVTKLPCRNIQINNVKCNSNRRNNMSVQCIDGLYVNGCEFKNASGTAPQSGIDLEPYDEAQLMTNIFIDNCCITGNVGKGINVYTHASGCEAILSNCVTDALYVNSYGEDNHFKFDNFIVTAKQGMPVLSYANATTSSSTTITNMTVDCSAYAARGNLESFLLRIEDTMNRLTIDGLTLTGGQMTRFFMYDSTVALMNAVGCSFNNIKIFNSTVLEDTFMMPDTLANRNSFFNRNYYTSHDMAVTAGNNQIGGFYQHVNITSITGTGRVNVVSRNTGDSVTVTNKTSTPYFLDFDTMPCYMGGEKITEYSFLAGQTVKLEYNWNGFDYCVGTVMP